MHNLTDTIIHIAAVLGAVLTIGGFVWMIIKWFLKQNHLKKELADLKALHEEDTNSTRDELCVLTYAISAVLDGLKQLNCNGEVSKAHEALIKHLNKQAHEQL